MRLVTFARTVLATVLFASLAVTAAAASPPHYVQRDVVFVTMNGQGTVRSVPKGLACPRECRAVFPRGTHVRLVARPAAGWELASFDSGWCTARRGVCQFDLVPPDECDSGVCPIGAYGVRVRFVRR